MKSTDEEPNPLERALSRASREPALLPEFYRQLLRSEIYLLGSRSDEEVDGGRQALTLIQWETEGGERIIPVFTSLEALRRSVDVEDDVLCMGVSQFLTLGTSLPLVLDPMSDHHAVLSADDVRALAEGHLPGVRGLIIQQGPLERDSELRTPEPQPAQLIDHLTTFLAGRLEVEAAWLGAFVSDETSAAEHSEAQAERKRPRFLIGLEVPAEVFEEVVEDVVCVIAQSATVDDVDTVDVIAMDSAQLADRLRTSAEPFYRRSWGARIMDPLHVGHA